MPNITKRIVDTLKPGKRDILCWDEKLAGFGVRCRPSGTKTYFLKYRSRSGRQRWLKLGKHGPLTPEQARARALRELAAIGDGADPSGAHQQMRKEHTIAELADRYFREHVEIHNKASTAKEIRRLIDTLVKPELGRFKVTELTRADIKAWHQRMSSTPTMANRALAACSKMLSLAVHDWELISSNPCVGLKRFPEKKRDRYFSDNELARIGRALLEAEQDKSELPGIILLIRLLATTGMRLGEALGLRWADVALADRAIKLIDAKTGGRTVHLGAAAVTVLDAITEREGYVVYGPSPLEPISRNMAEKAWMRLRKRAEVPDGRLHDFRHTAGTFAALSGANAFAVRDFLGHRTLAMTGQYVERAADMVRATSDAVSNRVMAAMNATQRAPVTVIKLSPPG